MFLADSPLLLQEINFSLLQNSAPMLRQTTAEKCDLIRQDRDKIVATVVSLN